MTPLKIKTFSNAEPALMNSDYPWGAWVSWSLLRKNLKELRQFAGPPRCLSGKESVCQCKRLEFDPWSGKIPRAMEQLSPCATTTEPGLHNCGENPGTAMKSGPYSPQLEKSPHSNRDPAQPKINETIKMYFKKTVWCWFSNTQIDQ